MGRTPRLAAPFRGERFGDVEHLDRLLAPPYDVLGAESRAAYADGAAHNIVHLTLPEGDGDRYEQARTLLRRWRQDAVLVRDAGPRVTVVEQTFSTPDGRRRVRTGVIVGVSVESFASARVLPHERTHAEPKQDRMALLRATGAMFESLLMFARDREGTLQELLAAVVQGRPWCGLSFDGVGVRAWVVGGRRGVAIARAASVESLYIADGHHRYETAVAFRGESPAADRIPALVVPLGDPGLVVLPTHRMVRGGAIDFDAVVPALRERFHVRELPPEGDLVDELAAARSRGTACVVALPEGRAVALLMKGGASLGDVPFANEPAVASLDVARVDEIVVKRLVQAAGPGASIVYTDDPGLAIAAPQRAEAAAAVLLNPVGIEQVLAVADAGAVMPPKSTYFFPKVPSGLVVMDFAVSD